jgi:hypothetical protein
MALLTVLPSHRVFFSAAKFPPTIALAHKLMARQTVAKKGRTKVGNITIPTISQLAT